MVRRFLYIILAIPILFLIWHTLVRIVRYFYKFPIPEFMAGAIDNPLRRRMQPPDEMPLRHGIEPGMRVLDVGPGNGRYTLATARRVGESGRVVAIDIEPKMVERVRARAEAEGVANVDARVADVYDLPFDEGSFDAAYMIAVIGEIPDPDQAMQEFYRVLKPGSTLAFSELLLDPDYPRARTLIRKASTAGFRLREKVGSFFYYTLVFEKPLPVRRAEG
jgi:ubiquinone/menaquinone biosynthesis C-methylase UbiE